MKTFEEFAYGKTYLETEKVREWLEEYKKVIATSAYEEGFSAGHTIGWEMGTNSHQ